MHLGSQQIIATTSHAVCARVVLKLVAWIQPEIIPGNDMSDAKKLVQYLHLNLQRAGQSVDMCNEVLACWVERRYQ